MSERPSIVVLGAKLHGIPAEDYLHLLRDRLPHHSVKLARTPRRERELIADTDVATGIQLDPELLDHATELRLFACGAAGVNHPPQATGGDRGRRYERQPCPRPGHRRTHAGVAARLRAGTPSSLDTAGTCRVALRAVVRRTAGVDRHSGRARSHR